MSTTILYPQKKTFNDIACLVKLFIKIMQCSRVGFVGDTNCAALLLNKLTNVSRAKSFIPQNLFVFEFYFAQKLNGTLRITDMSAGEQQSNELEIFVDESMDFGGLTASRHTDCLITMFIASPGSVLMRFAEG